MEPIILMAATAFVAMYLIVVVACCRAAKHADA
jgi:hypothetical protein